MAKNEYSFHTRRANKNMSLMPDAEPTKTKKTSLEEISMNNVKSTILGQYDKFLNLKASNPKVKYLSDTQEKISNEIIATVGLLQKSSKDVATQLSIKLNHLSDLHKKLKEEYTEILKSELSVLHENWPGIFDKVLEGVDRETLEHVLSVFEDHKKGRHDANQSVSIGVDYMTKKYKLPKDFFDKNAIDQFNQNMHKQNMED